MFKQAELVELRRSRSLEGAITGVAFTVRIEDTHNGSILYEIKLDDSELANVLAIENKQQQGEYVKALLAPKIKMIYANWELTFPKERINGADVAEMFGVTPVITAE
jgi:hypothetical protein